MGPYLTLSAKREMKKAISDTSDILHVAVNMTTFSCLVSKIKGIPVLNKALSHTDGWIGCSSTALSTW
jgi:hypothetical protein